MDRREFIKGVAGAGALLALGGIGKAEANGLQVPGRIYVEPVVRDFAFRHPVLGDIIADVGYLDPRHLLTLGITDIGNYRYATLTLPQGARKGKPEHPWAMSYCEIKDDRTWANIDGLANTPNLNIVRMDGAINDPIPAPLRARVQQVGAATQQELNTLTTYGEIVLFLLRKQIPTATLAGQFPELYGGG